MARRNRVEVEFKVTGDTGAPRRIGNEFKEAARDIQSVAPAFALFDAGAGRAVASLGAATRGVGGLGSTLGPLGVVVGALVVQFDLFVKVLGVGADALAAFAGFAKETIDASEALRRALLGLESVATFKGIDPKDATEAVRNLDLVKNGLLTVGEASAAVKNLLQSGFTLEQSIGIVERFGDSAAFGRQQALQFGQAVVSATEGIRNRNSILSDNAGLTKNLSLILKEQGFTLQDLDNATKRAAASEALYNGILRETAAQQGDAAKLAQGYAGSIARLAAGTTKAEEKIGALFTQNAALNEILGQGVRVLDLVNRNFDVYVTALSTFTPLLQVALIPLSLFVEALAAIAFAGGVAASGIGLVVEGTAELVGNAEQAARGRALRQMGEDLRSVANDAALAAARLPLAVAEIRKTLDVGRDRGGLGLGFKLLDLADGIPTIRQIVGFAQQLRRESETRAAIESHSAERLLEIYSKTLDIERQRVELGREFAAKLAVASGQNPLAVDRDAALAGVDAASLDRIREESERLDKTRADLQKAVQTELGKKTPDLLKVRELRAAIAEIDGAFAAFIDTNERLTETQRANVELEFAGKLAEQAETINRTITDLQASLLGDNPFVQFYLDAGRAIDDFGDRFGRETEAFRQFSDLTEQLLARQLDKARALQSLKLFDLSGDVQAFKEKAGLASPLSASEQNRRIFDQFFALQTGGSEALKVANEFLANAAKTGQLSAGALTGGQAQEVLNAFDELARNLTNQESQAQAVADAEKQERARIHREQIQAIAALTTALTVNTTAADGQTVAAGKLQSAIENGSIIEVRPEQGLFADVVTNGNAA